MKSILTLLAACVLTGSVAAQSTTPAPAKPVKHRSRHRVRPQSTSAAAGSPTVRTLGIETAPPTPATAQSARTEAQQRASDQKLLEQQQAESANAQRIQDQVVKTAQQQVDQRQREVRIQDAPGPAQTGVVPAAGLPVAPGNTDTRIQDTRIQDTRIQDAPGPAQTLPVPATPSQPKTQPQA